MNIEQIKKILDNAPEGATHWDKLQYYRIRYADSSLKVVWDVFNQGSGDFNSVGDTYLTDVYKIQSLSDLRQILALHEENEKLRLALQSVISNDEINTGYEPSLSCFQRSIDEAKTLLKGLTND